MKQTQKPVTVRFAIGDYAEIVTEAEAQNTTSADVVRRAWKSYQENKNFIIKLAQLERRLLRNTFEICTATIGLSAGERKNAAKQINNSFGKEVVK
jgi:hypothetical protein